MTDLQKTFNTVRDIEEAYTLDIVISNSDPTKHMFIIDRDYNSCDDFINRVYDTCRALDIDIVGHEQTNDVISFLLYSKVDLYALDVILFGSGEQMEEECLYPLENIRLIAFAHSIQSFCRDKEIGLSLFNYTPDGSFVELKTHTTAGMSAILQAYARHVFDDMAKELQQKWAKIDAPSLHLPKVDP